MGSSTPAGQPVAYSYLRFSSHGQAGGDSVRRQTANPEDWCTRNGVQLDTSLVFEDRPRSAFKKHHAHREALTQFRRFVAEGRIRPGSFLIVENLDRLSREEERIAVELLLSIVNAGITVVQLMPEEQTFSPTNLDMLGLMRAVIQLAQAHQESAKKAKRLGEVWGQKRKAAVAGTGTLTSRIPGWLDLDNGRMVPNPERVAVVKRIYKLCIDGYGGQATARKLNEEGVPTLTGRGKWYQSAVTYILRSRAVLGEHQPHTEHGVQGRVPVGEPIKDYYPPIVTEDVWNAAQGAMSGRITLAGRPPVKRSNIFRRLLRDARGGGMIGIATHVWDGGRTQVFCNSDRAAGVKAYSFPAEVFERTILSLLKEVNPREVIGERAAAERVLALTGERGELVTKIEHLAALIENDPSPTIATKIRAREAELRALDEKLELARQEAANPLTSAWGDLPDLVELAGTDDGRVKLAAVLRRIVAQIRCLFVPRGQSRLAAVQIQFNRGTHRDYVISYSPPHAASERTASWSVRSLTLPGNGSDLDLRDPAHVAELEKALAAVDMKGLGLG